MSGINISYMNIKIDKSKLKAFKKKAKEFKELKIEKRPRFYDDFIKNMDLMDNYFRLLNYHITYDEEAIIDFLKFIQPFLDFREQPYYNIILTESLNNNAAFGFDIYKDKIMYNDVNGNEAYIYYNPSTEYIKKGCDKK